MSLFQKHYSTITLRLLVCTTWFLLCISACSLQIYSIASSYFSYSIYQRVTMIQEDVITLPSLTVCFPFVDLMDWRTPWGKRMKPIVKSYLPKAVTTEMMDDIDTLISLVRRNLTTKKKNALAAKLQLYTVTSR